MGFNPCCFGSLVRAYSHHDGDGRGGRVSILVVLDHWFGLAENYHIDLDDDVSILVVLDHWFGHGKCLYRVDGNLSFNPCCFGSLVRALPPIPAVIVAYCFNPCCFGSLVRASLNFSLWTAIIRVSILVVLDHWFGQKPCEGTRTAI